MRIMVKVAAGARREKMAEVSTGRFEISVREEAERNMANKRVIELLAAHFGVEKKHVRLEKGHRSPTKTIEVSL